MPMSGKEMKKLYEQIELMPGFLDFFAKIKPKYKAAVATSSNIDLFNILDKKFSITQLFENHVYFLKDVNNVSKPEPDIFLYAAKMLATAPSESLVIEDAPLGIEAAKKAGMRSVGLTSSYPRETLAQATQIVDKFEEINLEQF